MASSFFYPLKTWLVCEHDQSLFLNVAHSLSTDDDGIARISLWCICSPSSILSYTTWLAQTGFYWVEEGAVIAEEQI